MQIQLAASGRRGQLLSLKPQLSPGAMAGDSEDFSGDDDGASHNGARGLGPNHNDGRGLRGPYARARAHARPSPESRRRPVQ